jgi:hypothetical protein
MSTVKRVLFTVALVACAVALPLAAGCTKGSSAKKAGSDVIQVAPGVSFPKTAPSAPQAPPPPMLRSPQTSVYSYLLWISYSYRILNSDVATMAFSPYEEVRVNSYVELNKEQGRAIDQRLVEFKIKGVQTKDNTATVTAEESWAYRYIDTRTLKYSSDVLRAAYDTTYTVVENAKKQWLVDKVEATPRGEVK